MVHRFAFVVLSALVVFSRAAPQLSTQIFGPGTVNDIAHLGVTTIVRNIGDETVRLFKHPLSPLSSAPTNKFSIKSRDGTSPQFIGIEVTLADNAVVLQHEDSAFVTLSPDEAIETYHPISEGYDFTSSGPGSYAIEMKNSEALYYEVDGQFRQTSAVNAMSLTVHVSGTLSAKHLATNSKDDFCHARQKEVINEAIPIANSYAREALEGLKVNKDRGLQYKRWFGAPDKTRYKTVLSHFTEIVSNNFSEYTWVCNNEICADNPYYLAFVFPSEFGTVNLCPLYFSTLRTPLRGIKSRASTLVHEASHFNGNGGTRDIEYNVQKAQELARYEPERAIMNAASHEFFSVDTATRGFRGAPGSQNMFEVLSGVSESPLGGCSGGFVQGMREILAAWIPPLQLVISA